MREFRLFAQVTHLGPAEFVVIASAVPDDGATGTIVQSVTAPSRDVAHSEMDRLLIELGRRVRECGGRVVDVLT